MRRKRPAEPVDMYNMIGVCPEPILKSQVRYALRNTVDSSDEEVAQMQKKLVGYMRDSILGTNILDGDGLVLHSGSEANEVALLLCKRACNKRVVLVSSLCHSSIEQSCAKLGMAVVKLDVDGQTLKVDPIHFVDAVRKYGDDLAMVCLTFGTTKLGTSEDISFNEEVEQILFQKNVWVHIDGAYGGTVLSLLGRHSNGWKRYRSVRSFSVDTHKFVGSLGCSILLLQKPSDRKLLGDEVVYFPGNASQLGTTRSAYPAATALACIRKYGRNGLKKLAQHCHDLASDTALILEKDGFHIMAPIDSGVVPITLNSMKEIDQYREQLVALGYRVSPISFTSTDGTIYGIRIVVTPKKEMTKRTLSGFIKAINVARTNIARS